jgi:hypothetical protein
VFYYKRKSIHFPDKKEAGAAMPDEIYSIDDLGDAPERASSWIGSRKAHSLSPSLARRSPIIEFFFAYHSPCYDSSSALAGASIHVEGGAILQVPRSPVVNLPSHTVSN